jgi:hypothetical protein
MLPLLLAAVLGVPGLVPGTYVQADPVTKKPLAVGSQLVVIAGKGGKVGFSINAVRALDANQGFIAGVLPKTLPGTWSQSTTSGNCRLHFAPAVRGVTVTQDLRYGDCGFGEGVTATGMYVLRPERPLKA